MATPEKPQASSLPVFRVESVTSTIENNGKVYARLISLEDKERNLYKVRERTGIVVENYKDKPLECVLEIVKARFFDLEELKEKKLNPPGNAIQGTFAGWNTGYKFFPELVEIVDGETGSADDEDFDEDAYDILATELFAQWGISGFGLDVYRDKPMIKTEDGVFFLNEFIFEEFIDQWEESLLPNVKVCLVIDELLLHGIKPYEGKFEIKKTLEEIYDVKPYEKLIIGDWIEIDNVKKKWWQL
jgi:hypothetical protein